MLTPTGMGDTPGVVETNLCQCRKTVLVKYVTIASVTEIAQDVSPPQLC